MYIGIIDDAATGSSTADTTFDKSDFRNIVPRFSEENRKANAGLVEVLGKIADGKGATRAQIALAWLLKQEGTIVIPKASRPAHVRENRGALDVALDEEDLAALDRAFPPPKRKHALGML